MSVQAVLLPVFAQVALLYLLFARMALTRISTIKSGETKMKDVALGQNAWPTKVAQIGNSYSNNLELPLLFYALVPLAMLTKKDDLLFVVMSWLFVLSRYAHAWVHINSNHVPTRFNLFALGAVVLGLMWIIFAARILAAI